MRPLTQGLSRRVRSEGVWSAAQDAATRAWRRVFRHRQLVFELSADAAAELAAPTARAQIHTYREPAELSPALRAEFTAHHGPSFVAYVETTLRNGATLYVLQDDDHIASLLWAKRGDRVSNWYVPVGASDVILYGWWTDPHRRGQGLIRLLIAAATRDALPQARRFLADVRVWNTPSIRAMERVGFRRIAEAKPR